MKSGANALHRYRILSVVLSILLVLSSCVVLTGSWFTYSTVIKGNFTEPEYSFTVKYNSEPITSKDNKILLTYNDVSDLSNTLTMKVNQGTNVTKNVMRVYISFEWGIMQDEIFTSDIPEPLENALVVNYTNEWTGSRAVQDPENYLYDPAVWPTYYYYNNIVNSSSEEITIFSSLSFAEGTNLELYSGKSVQISIYIEILPASEETLTVDFGIEGEDTYYLYGDYAPASWVTSIKNKLSQ